ncbi:MAG TPA: hypothetical protein VGH90_04380, partial [Chthoniobacteraceae bacterium]
MGSHTWRARCTAAALFGVVALSGPSAWGATDSASAPLPSVAPGWKLELIAAAPKIRQPAALVCAPDGKVFVGEDPMDM